MEITKLFKKDIFKVVILNKISNHNKFITLKKISNNAQNHNSYLINKIKNLYVYSILKLLLPLSTLFN